MSRNIRIKMLWTIAITLSLIVPMTVIGVTRLGTDDSGQGWYGDDIGQIEAGLGKAFTLTFANLQTVCAIPNIEIKLPSCNITFTGTLDIVSGIHIYGCGNSTIFYADASLNANMVNIVSQTNVWIEGIVFDGNNWSRSQTDLNYSIIDITGTAANPSQNNTITYCTIKNGQVKAMIDIQEYCNYNTVSFCNIDSRMQYHGLNWGYGEGVWLSADNNKVLFNTIKDTYAFGVGCETSVVGGLPSGKYNIIEGNIITGKISVGIYNEGTGSADYQKSGNNTIINNVIYDINSTAYLDTAGGYSIGIKVTENSYISGNIIHGVHKWGIFIVACNFSIIDSNRIYNVYGAGCDGIVVGAGGGETSKIIISNNIINDIYDDGIVLSEDTITAQVTNNQLNNIGDTAINAYDGTSSQKNWSITGNTIYNCVYGMYIMADYCIVSMNMIDKCTADGINLHGCDNHSVIGNRISYCNSDGIEINDCKNSTLMGNIIFFCVDGIDESSTSNGNIILGNQCDYNSAQDIDIDGTDTVQGYNKGTVS